MPVNPCRRSTFVLRAWPTTLCPLSCNDTGLRPLQLERCPVSHPRSGYRLERTEVPYTIVCATRTRAGTPAYFEFRPVLLSTHRDYNKSRFSPSQYSGFVGWTKDRLGWFPGLPLQKKKKKIGGINLTERTVSSKLPSKNHTHTHICTHTCARARTRTHTQAYAIHTAPCFWVWNLDLFPFKRLHSERLPVQRVQWSDIHRGDTPPWRHPATATNPNLSLCVCVYLLAHN